MASGPLYLPALPHPSFFAASLPDAFDGGKSSPATNRFRPLCTKFGRTRIRQFQRRNRPRSSPFRGISDFIMRNPDEIAAWAGKPLVERITPALLEEVDDTRGPVSKSMARRSGGSYLIKNQSICPFKAFAETRLYGREWDEGIFAFDQRDRGTFIHNALAIFWREVQTSEQAAFTIRFRIGRSYRQCRRSGAGKRAGNDCVPANS